MEEQQNIVIQPEGEGNEDAFARLQAQNQLLLQLFRVAAQLTAELGSEDLEANAVRIIADTLPEIDVVGLWLYNRADKRLRLAAMHSSADAPVFDVDMAEIALRLHEGGVGDVVAIRQPILLSDRLAYQRSLATLDPPNAVLMKHFAAQLPLGVRVVVLPLYLGGIPIGALELFDIGVGPIAAAADLPLLQAFADQLAVVFRNAQIYAEMTSQHRRLQAFDAVVTAISTAADMPQMLEQVLSVTLYVVGATGGALALLNEVGGRVEVSSQLMASQFEAGASLDVDQPLLVDVLRVGQPAIEPVSENHPWSELRTQNIDTVALLPLMAGGSSVGVILIGLSAGRQQQLDWPSLMAIGNQIGIAVANYQLYQASQRERRQLAGVIASIAEGVLLCDANGDLVLSNQMATEILGYSFDPGTAASDLTRILAMRTMDGGFVVADMMPLAKSLRGEIFHNYELIVTSADGRDLVISSSGAPLVADTGHVDGAVVVFRDMTVYKQHEALRDEFVAVAAHELRAPLAAIKGYTDLLVQREVHRPDATDRDRRGIMMLSRQVDHLVRLVDNLLDVSRLDAGRLQLYLQPVDLVTLIDASMDRISIGDRDHQFVFNGPPTLQIVCDQLRLQQVFTNLLSNAARYSASGTTITVDVWTETCADGRSSQEQANQCVVVAVRDQGVGMTPEVQAKVYDRYYRANTVTSASGLGLGVYISREIVMLHGGQIWLESLPNVGTSFYVKIPIQPPAVT